jgi:hypothetical protein
MTFCTRCGKELKEGDDFCSRCGARVGGEGAGGRWEGRWGDHWELRWQRHRWRETERDGLWGAFRGFGFLIILGLAVILYPDVFSLIVLYFKSWGTHGYPVLPGHALGDVIVFLLYAGGVWGLFTSLLRLVFSHRLRRPLRHAVGALFSLYFAYALTRFYAGAMRGSGLVFAFFVGLACLVLANALIFALVPRRRGVGPGTRLSPS